MLSASLARYAADQGVALWVLAQGLGSLELCASVGGGRQARVRVLRVEVVGNMGVLLGDGAEVRAVLQAAL